MEPWQERPDRIIERLCDLCHCPCLPLAPSAAGLMVETAEAAVYELVGEKNKVEGLLISSEAMGA